MIEINRTSLAFKADEVTRQQAAGHIIDLPVDEALFEMTGAAEIPEQE